MIEVAEKTEEEVSGKSGQAIVEEIENMLGGESGPFLSGLLTGLKLRHAKSIEPAGGYDFMDRRSLELGLYVAERFSGEDAARLYGRFLIEAQGEHAAHTPGGQTTSEEHLSYVVKNIIEALGFYTPSYQRKALVKYIKEVLPRADAEYDEAEEEAQWAHLSGEAERAEDVRDIINVLQKVPTGDLPWVLEELTKRIAD